MRQFHDVNSNGIHWFNFAQDSPTTGIVPCFPVLAFSGAFLDAARQFILLAFHELPFVAGELRKALIVPAPGRPFTPARKDSQ